MGRQHKVINYYAVSQAVWDEEKGKYVNNELYGTTSMLRMVLYLRDLWYLEQGKELPTDQDIWNSIRKELAKDGKYGSQHSPSIAHG